MSDLAERVREVENENVRLLAEIDRLQAELNAVEKDHLLLINKVGSG